MRFGRSKRTCGPAHLGVSEECAGAYNVRTHTCTPDARKGVNGKMAYDESAFNEALNENLSDDPYSTVVFIIKEAMKAAATYNGTMNNDEYALLTGAARFIDERDPHIGILAAMSDAFELNPHKEEE